MTATALRPSTILGASLLSGASLVLGSAVAFAPVPLALGAVGAALTAIALYLPGVLLALYVVVPSFFKAALQPYAPIDLTLLLAALCAPQALYLLRRPEAIRGIAVWAALTLVIIASVLWALDSYLAQDRGIYWLALGFLPLLAAVRVAADERHVRHFLRVVLAAAALMVFAGLAGFDPSVRTEALGANTIQSARAALMVPILAVALRDEPWPVRALAIGLTPVAVYVALSTGSRGALVALFVVGGLILVSLLRDRRRLMAALFALLALTVIGSFVVAELVVLPRAALDRYTLLGIFSGDAVQSEAARWSVYDNALAAFADAPLLGIGIGNFAVFEPVLRYPHNLVLQFAAELGMVGLVALGAVLWTALSRRSDGYPWAAVRWLALFLVVGAMFSGDAVENRMMWAMIVLLIAAPTVGRGNPVNGSRPRAAS
jgi:O-antigen ligase